MSVRSENNYRKDESLQTNNNRIRGGDCNT